MGALAHAPLCTCVFLLRVQEMLYTMYPAAAARGGDSDVAARYEEDAEALLSHNGAASSGLPPPR